MKPKLLYSVTLSLTKLKESYISIQDTLTSLEAIQHQIIGFDKSLKAL